jgi:hypothetical protein
MVGYIEFGEDPLPADWKAIMSHDCPATEIQDWICRPADVSMEDSSALKRTRTPSPSHPKKSQRIAKTGSMPAPHAALLVCEPERSDYSIDQLNELVLGPLRMFYEATIDQLELRVHPLPPGPRIEPPTVDN